MNFYFLSIILNVIFLYFWANNFYQRKIIENEALDLFDDFEKYKQENEKKDEEIVRLTLENNRLTSQLKYSKCDKKCKKQKK